MTAGSLLTPGDRKRDGYNVSLQWRPNENLEFYSDVLYTEYRNKHDVNFFIGFPRGGWLFSTARSVSLVPGTNVVRSIVTTPSNFHLTCTQAFDDKTDSYQAVGGFKCSRDQLSVSSGLVYNGSSFKNRGVIVDTQYVAPSAFSFDLNNNKGTNATITGGDVRNPANYRLWGLFDNHGYATSRQTGWKADADYKLGQSLFTNIKGGVRYSTREARNRQTSVNDIAPTAGRGATRADRIRSRD